MVAASQSDSGEPGSRISRRAFLKAGGAGAVGATATLGSVAYAKQRWDREVDVIVVGSGAAASSAALFAREAKAQVLILEKALVYGGTTAKSGGVFWIPNNYLMRERGWKDERADWLRFVARISYPTLYNPADRERFGLPEDTHQMHATYYDEAAPTIDALRALGFKTEYWPAWNNEPMPDYYGQLPENKAIYGRALMPSAVGDTINGAALIKQLKTLLEQRQVPALLGHRVVRLIVGAKREVLGVEVLTDEDKTLHFRARRGVVFGTGGFTSNPEMSLNFLRGPIFGGCTVPTGEGDLIPMATAVRAKLGNMNNAWWWPLVLEQALQSRSVPTGIGTIPGDSVILVNADGKRCVNEKIQYNERTQAHFYWDPVRARYPNLLMFMIYDQSCRERYAEAPAPINRGLFMKPGVNAPYILSGDTLEELTRAIEHRLDEIADRTGDYRLDAHFVANLHESITRFNGFAQTGKDLDFHRGESPYQIAAHGEPRNPGTPNVTMRPISGTGPYYAIMFCAGTLDTKGGPKTNTAGEVMDVDEKPIRGLYGAGNCVASASGQAYWSGGATLGLALVFGALAGKSAARAPITQVSEA